MEQKDYKLEVIEQLLKQPSHIRAIAKKLDINHMMIKRKIHELLNQNVVDYREEGKNKVYFLKKTIEAKAYVYMAENYKQIKILEIYPVLRKVFENLHKKNIKLAILFGSYAKKLAKKDSDVDVYIETTDKNLKKELELSDSKLSIKIGKFDKNNLLMKEIEKNHVIIKGIEEYYGFFEKDNFGGQAGISGSQ